MPACWGKKPLKLATRHLALKAVRTRKRYQVVCVLFGVVFVLFGVVFLFCFVFGGEGLLLAFKFILPLIKLLRLKRCQQSTLQYCKNKGNLVQAGRRMFTAVTLMHNVLRWYHLVRFRETAGVSYSNSYLLAETANVSYSNSVL